jgi:hypothetical protein
MDFTAAPLRGHTEVIDPSAETVINGAPFDARPTVRAATQPPPDQASDGLSEAVKRRQIALAVRYISMVSSATR